MAKIVHYSHARLISSTDFDIKSDSKCFQLVKISRKSIVFELETKKGTNQAHGPKTREHKEVANAEDPRHFFRLLHVSAASY